MEEKDLIVAGERILATAKKAGATGVFCSISLERQKSVEVRNGKVEDRTLQGGVSFSGVVLVGNREAPFRSTSLASEDIIRSVKDAVAMTKVVSENKYVRLARRNEWPCSSKELPAKIEALKLYSGDRAPSLKELEEWALEFDRIARRYPGVSRSEKTSFGYGREVRVRMTSNGFLAVSPRTNYSKATSVIAERDGEMKSAGEYHAAIELRDLRSDDECARRASEYAVSSLGAEPIPTEVLPVVFDNRVSSRLVNAFFSAITGELVYKKSTFLLPFFGGSIFPSDVHIIEQPHLSGNLGSRLFDAECVATKPRILVENGKLKMWATTIESGEKLGIPSTGHASGASNLLFLPGSKTQSELIRDIDRGFLVTDLMGRGVNIATGDYSTGAEGFLIEKGKITRPVNEVTIAGNLLSMWRTLIPGSDVSDHIGTNAPSLLIEKMTVGGK